MSTYRIIDEPKVRPTLERFIVDPTIILFVSIFVPLFINLPVFGRFWIPIVWLIFNGYALGSPTLGKEIRTIILGAVSIGLIFFVFVKLLDAGYIAFEIKDAAPYLSKILFGTFFLILYLVVFRQSMSYELYSYIHKEDS